MIGVAADAEAGWVVDAFELLKTLRSRQSRTAASVLILIITILSPILLVPRDGSQSAVSYIP